MPKFITKSLPLSLDRLMELSSISERDVVVAIATAHRTISPYLKAKARKEME